MSTRILLAFLGLLFAACTVRTAADVDSGTPETMDGRVVIPDAFARPDTNSSCAAGTIDCFGTCTAVVGDSQNCGSCGNVCPSGTSCAIGRCDCMAPMLGCDGECFDVGSSHEHCGTCANACAANEVCRSGTCHVECPAGMGACGGACIDVQADPVNCGNCGVRCTTGTSCINGICSCPGTQAACSGTCTDTMTDPANCGTCLNRCGTGGTCAAGVCATCGTGLSRCGTPARCYDTMTSTLHCGACGHACGAGQTCTAGVCGCRAPLVACGTTTCFDLTSSVNHCADCDTDCGPGGACTASVCTCASGFTMCGAECADVMTSEEHCGNCPTTCSAGQECRTGVCTPVPTFRILTMGATGCAVVDHMTASGDDRGGVAVSPSTFFVNADTSMVRMSATDLSGITAISAIHDSVLSDIGTEQIYVMLTAAGTEVGSGGIVTQLGVLDPMTGALTATRVALSAPITLAYGTGIFSGWGAAYLGVPATSSVQWWHIELPSGAVTRLGTTSTFTHNTCETWAYWGIAERYGGIRYATYVASDTQVSRVAIPEMGMTTATPTAVATFTRLANMCSITFSTSRNRWYFHHEYDSQFGGNSSGETAGYCPATFDRP